MMSKPRRYWGIIVLNCDLIKKLFPLIVAQITVFIRNVQI